MARPRADEDQGCPTRKESSSGGLHCPMSWYRLGLCTQEIREPASRPELGRPCAQGHGRHERTLGRARTHLHHPVNPGRGEGGRTEGPSCSPENNPTRRYWGLPPKATDLQNSLKGSNDNLHQLVGSLAKAAVLNARVPRSSQLDRTDKWGDSRRDNEGRPVAGPSAWVASFPPPLRSTASRSSQRRTPLVIECTLPPDRPPAFLKSEASA